MFWNKKLPVKKEVIRKDPVPHLRMYFSEEEDGHIINRCRAVTFGYSTAADQRTIIYKLLLDKTYEYAPTSENTRRQLVSPLAIYKLEKAGIITRKEALTLGTYGWVELTETIPDA